MWEECKMAKYTKSFEGDYNHFIEYVEKEIVEGSMSASIEDRYHTVLNNVHCTILVFERYSYTGGNRVSMNVTILGYQNHIELIAVTAGGSKATFFKVNTWGEEAFLEKLIYPVEEYIKKNMR